MSDNDEVIRQLKEITRELEKSGKSCLIQSLITALTFKTEYSNCEMPAAVRARLIKYHILDNKGNFASSDIRQKVTAIMQNQSLYSKLIKHEE